MCLGEDKIQKSLVETGTGTRRRKKKVKAVALLENDSEKILE